MDLNKFLLYFLTAFIFVVIVLITIFIGKRRKDNKTKSLVFAAVSIALSFALSYVRLFQLPMGGSVTLASLLPIMLYSYMFGIRKGVLVGALFGILQFIQMPWFYSPVQFILDYPLAFSAIGLTGMFMERGKTGDRDWIKFLLGALVGVILRYACHVVSGIFVFGSGDPENYSAVAWSFLYNSFALVDMAICLVPGCMMLISKAFKRVLEKAAK